MQIKCPVSTAKLLPNLCLSDFAVMASKKEWIGPLELFKESEIKIYLHSFMLWATTHYRSTSCFIPS